MEMTSRWECSPGEFNEYLARYKSTWKKELAEKLESRDFYELCQEYRHASVDAASQFEALKHFLLMGKLPWPSYEE